MNNQPTVEKTEEQIDQEIRESLAVSIKLGKQLAKLRKTPEFKAVFEKVFLEQGLEVLWQNVRHLEEGQMIGKGNDKNLEIIKLIKGQIKTRLDFSGFMDTVENDSINAVAELEEMDKEAEAGEEG